MMSGRVVPPCGSKVAEWQRIRQKEDRRTESRQTDGQTKRGAEEDTKLGQVFQPHIDDEQKI